MLNDSAAHRHAALLPRFLRCRRPHRMHEDTMALL